MKQILEDILSFDSNTADKRQREKLIAEVFALASEYVVSRKGVPAKTVQEILVNIPDSSNAAGFVNREDENILIYLKERVFKNSHNITFELSTIAHETTHVYQHSNISRPIYSSTFVFSDCSKLFNSLLTGDDKLSKSDLKTCQDIEKVLYDKNPDEAEAREFSVGFVDLITNEMRKMDGNGELTETQKNNLYDNIISNRHFSTTMCYNEGLLWRYLDSQTIDKYKSFVSKLQDKFMDKKFLSSFVVKTGARSVFLPASQVYSREDIIDGEKVFDMVLKMSILTEDPIKMDKVFNNFMDIATDSEKPLSDFDQASILAGLISVYNCLDYSLNKSTLKRFDKCLKSQGVVGCLLPADCTGHSLKDFEKQKEVINFRVFNIDRYVEKYCEGKCSDGR